MKSIITVDVLNFSRSRSKYPYFDNDHIFQNAEKTTSNKLNNNLLCIQLVHVLGENIFIFNMWCLSTYKENNVQTNSVIIEDVFCNHTSQVLRKVVFYELNNYS
jgi:hypothetical protein